MSFLIGGLQVFFFIILCGIPIINIFIVVKYYRGVFPRILSYLFFVVFYLFIAVYLIFYPSVFVANYIKVDLNFNKYIDFFVVPFLIFLGFFWGWVFSLIFRLFLKKRDITVIFFQSSLYTVLAIVVYIAISTTSKV